MTPEQAKRYAQIIAVDSKPGPKGEAPRLTKAQAMAATTLLGAQLAAQDPVTGEIDKQVAEKLQAGMTAAVLSQDPDAVAFRNKLLALDPQTVDFATALQAGAQHVVDEKGQQIDAKLQADLAALAAFAAAVPAGAEVVAVAPVKG
jgi:hypothetical protein